MSLYLLSQMFFTDLETPFIVDTVESESDVYDYEDLDLPGPIVPDSYECEGEIVPEIPLGSDSEDVVGEVVPETPQWVLDFHAIYCPAIKRLPKVSEIAMNTKKRAFSDGITDGSFSLVNDRRNANELAVDINLEI
ncbi:hypothetical protein OROMI_023114 [Orobanche minor]